MNKNHIIVQINWKHSKIQKKIVIFECRNYINIFLGVSQFTLWKRFIFFKTNVNKNIFKKQMVSGSKISIARVFLFARNILKHLFVFASWNGKCTKLCNYSIFGAVEAKK
jgi:hypothetical protein